MVYEKDRLSYYFENTTRGSFRSVQESLITSFQHGLLKSRLTWTFPDASVRNWMLAIHAGMTKFVGERKLMTHRDKVIL